MINLTLQEKEQLSRVLSLLADSIDLTEAQYKLATERYNSVGEFLSGPTSSLRSLSPVIRPQGSFRTGTATRPIHEDSEFDVDLTCLLQLSLPNIQSHVKELVGKRLRTDQRYREMLEEMQRCWRLKYAEASRFHLDIVPAIPDTYEWLLTQGVPIEYAKHAVNITDNKRTNYDSKTVEFPKSNPEGYAMWFLDVMKLEAEKIRMQLKKELLLEKVEDVPEYKVRTPLQRGVQLMKRHRDIMFEEKDDCPISIILTTLAARAYQEVVKKHPSTVFYDVLVKMVELMPSFIENRNGVKWVPNPVNPKENFADKWQLPNNKERNFYQWHSRFLQSLRSDNIKKGVEVLGTHLKDGFGSRSVNEVFNKIGKGAHLLREAGVLKASSTGLIGGLGAVIKSHTFDGNDEK